MSSHFIDTSDWSLPKNLVLADPNFNRPDKIDILLGAEHFLQLLLVGQIEISPQLPILQNTVLGWIVSGKIKDQNSKSLAGGVSATNNDLEASIAKLWELDEIKTSDKHLSLAERQCEELFTRNTTRNKENRLVVRILFHQNPEPLNESYRVALNRFLSLEHRLRKNPELKIEYTKFMNEYEAMKHMTEISYERIKSPYYFIPHHCVLKPESSTTKLRVVFDASGKTSSGHFFNDMMYTGPTVQSELFSILLKFHLPRFVFSTDVGKMCRQILVVPEDRKFQLIIWWTYASKPLTYFQLNTVTYGMRSAPYLATKCLQQLAKENATRCPLESQFFKDNLYVDDGLGGNDSLSTVIQIQEQLQQMMKQSGFTLRKWCANHPQLLKNVPPGDLERNLDFESTKSHAIGTLGLTWLPKEDQLCIKVSNANSKRITKHTVMADLARIFDPLGLLSPIAVKAKIFIQELWKLKLNWDQALPESMHTKWMTFRAELTELQTLKISRHIFKGGLPDSIQLHVFSDASEEAYGAAAYLQATMKNDIIMTQLLCAKSRVAPLKTQTIPRLELCSAVLAAQLIDFIYQVNHKNSFWRLQRIVGYILRFVNNIKCKSECRQLERIFLTTELRNALMIIIKQMQASEFKEKIQHLTKYKELRGSNNLSNLSPFVDAEGIIRVGSRLEASSLEYNSKHQTLIPYNDPIYI